MQAACAPPKSAGAVICFPTPNSTITQTPIFEAAATGESGGIVRMILYADGVKVLQMNNLDSFATQVYGGPAAYNGKHHYVLQAYDQGGHLFQTSEYLTELDGIVRPCASPSSGFTICSPTQGSFQPSSTQISIGGAPNITEYSVYFNGILQGAFINGQNLNGVFGTPVNGKPITMKVVAKTTSGGTITKTLAYTGYLEAPNCGDYGCGEGLVVNSPSSNYEDTTSPIVVNAEVQGDSNPIKLMQLYFDSKLIATSTGPTLRQNVPAAHGTHLVTVQAYDTKNVMYRVRQDVNVQ